MITSSPTSFTSEPPVLAPRLDRRAQAARLQLTRVDRQERAAPNDAGAQVELQARCLGASVEAWSEDGQPLEDEVGELVITQPMPSMPIYSGGARTLALPVELLRDVPGRVASRDWIKITGRGRGDLRPLGIRR